MGTHAQLCVCLRCLVGLTTEDIDEEEMQPRSATSVATCAITSHTQQERDANYGSGL